MSGISSGDGVKLCLLTRAELLKAWLALTLAKQYQNQYVVKVLNAG